SRNTIAQGMPARAGLPIFLVRVSVFLRTSLRVHRAPGIPCALHLFEGQALSQSSGDDTSRECGPMFVVIASQAKQSTYPLAALWIASSRSLSSGRPKRAGPVGSSQ